MKRLNRIFLIGTILLIFGLAWAFTMNDMGTIEWVLLLSGIVFGILAGLIQGWAISQKKQGKIGSGIGALWVIGTIIVLIAVKVSLNIVVPSSLATSEQGIWLSIVVAIGGLLLGRSLYSRLR